LNIQILQLKLKFAFKSFFGRVNKMVNICIFKVNLLKICLSFTEIILFFDLFRFFNQLSIATFNWK
jgi:hypothetical protein